MAGLPAVTHSEHHRARRWDALVLGSGLPSLVAAIRLGLAGHRTLVVEEDRARALHPALREPFCLSGVRDEGVVDSLLRELKIPLIDQRRIADERVALQVVSPKARFDLGGPGVTAHELVAWGFCDRERAGALTRRMVEATEAERQVMLASPVVRLGRRIGRPRLTASGPSVRGLPSELARPEAQLAPLFDAVCTSLSNLGSLSPTPEARARLLGCGLAGGSGFADGPPWLHGLLRRRVESVYGEFRTLGTAFELVSLDGSPAIRHTKTGELWVGRMLVVGAPVSAVARQLEERAASDLFGELRPHTRRARVHLRASPDVLPQGMCPRVVMLRDAAAASTTDDVITLNASADPDVGDGVDLVARMRIAEDASEAEAETAMLARIHELMPFSQGRLERRPIERPLWDDVDWLEDPVRGEGWPTEVDLRVDPKASVYRLDRAGVAGLGVEGDLLLGWRAGDALAEELG
jgi:hypothetical protein